MKFLLVILTCLLIQNSACNKSGNDDCNSVTITQSGTACGNWAIKVNGIVYPSGNIPDEFKVEGMPACANYDLYEDMRACVCCGGTWANIHSMKHFIF